MSDIKDAYFFRAAAFDLTEEKKLRVKDPVDPAYVIEMDALSENVFLAAEGDITVERFICNTVNDYPSVPAKKLRTGILKRVEEMDARGIIRTDDHPGRLPEHLASPLSGQAPGIRPDPKQDGFPDMEE